MESALLSFRNLIQQFVKLTDEEWQMLVPHLSEKVIKKNDYMIREGQIGNELGYVVQGDMRLALSLLVQKNICCQFLNCGYHSTACGMVHGN